MTGAVPEIRFPVFKRLEVRGYGLYPGANPAAPELVVTFQPGLTLIVGTNGLGKTTLVTLLYKMLAGGYDLPRSTLAADELGSSKIAERRLNATERALFARRVDDEAIHATATLDVQIGATQCRIIRRLDNLALTAFEENGQVTGLNEDTVRARLAELAGVHGFADFLLALRLVVFYFEDRRSLVWDRSAQRQLFRLLFLPKADAAKWYDADRRILELDSQIRNDRAVITRMAERLAKQEAKSADSAELRAQLLKLSRLQENDRARQNELALGLEASNFERRRIRQELLHTQRQRADLERALETARLDAVYAYFPSHDATSTYLLSLLVADGRCSVCEADVPALQAELEIRADKVLCVLCGSPSAQAGAERIATPIDQARLAELRHAIAQCDAVIAAQQATLAKVVADYEADAQALGEIIDRLREREPLILSLQQAIPEADEYHVSAREELAGLRETLNRDMAELQQLAREHGAFIEASNQLLLQHASAIKTAFGRFAKGFLLEDVELRHSVDAMQLGQLQAVQSVSFQLDMTGSNFGRPHRREGPEAVSESQREFIDLAFRMALIEVAGAGHGGSLVIDAPESSLDAVFAERAAVVLCRFAEDPANRLVVASNLVEGRLLPELLKRGTTTADVDSRVVNLLDHAVPTAAVTKHRAEYEHSWRRIRTEAGRL